MSLAEYLKSKHLEHCNKLGYIVTEADWVKNTLNPMLPEGDKLSKASVNQWMNGDRSPDTRNVIRLLKVFGPEVMPYVGIEIKPDLARIMREWEKVPEPVKQEINGLIDAALDDPDLVPYKIESSVTN